GSAGKGRIRAAWYLDETGLLTLEVTDGGGPTRPRPSSPSLTAHGGRGLGIVDQLALDWGVYDDTPGEVTVWAVLSAGGDGRREDLAGSLVNGAEVAAVADLAECGEL